MRFARRLGDASEALADLDFFFFFFACSLRNGIKSAAPLYVSAARKDGEIETALLAAGLRGVSSRL